jgi:type VI secretion system secreted protein VgrG
VKKVFKDHGVADFEFKLFRTAEYREWPYCVQYRESDLNFVLRLLEQEGIYWYFQHSDGKHKLMLVDMLSVHDAAPGYDTLPYFANAQAAPPDTEYVSDWSFSREVRTGKLMLTSYDFERPSATDLKVELAEPRSHPLADYEQFDFQGDYVAAAHGKLYADNRIHELQARFERISGHSNAHGLGTGHLFSLSNPPHTAHGSQFLCVSTSIQAQVDAYESGSEPGRFDCSFSAIPAKQQFRPARRTPKPFVQGPQTAVVTGPAGEEIHTDKYGRVKVQFHWDRYGKNDEKSSCWVRVATPWAGTGFGFVQVPRIGQEVVVDFLEGDPDQPLITGRVYNAQNMPPWELPGNATQSGVLTRSSKGGAYANANAVRFEDKKGEEQLWIHAEKNQDIEVENDETHWVGHDRRKTIDNDEMVTVHGFRTEVVDKDEQITIHQNRNERVDLNEDISVGKNRTEEVGDNENVTIGKDRINRIGKNHQETIGANHKVSIGKSQSVTIGKNLTQTVSMANFQNIGMAKVVNVGLGYMVNVGAAYSLNTGGLMNVVVGAAYNEQVLKGRAISAGDDVKITAGKTLSITGEQKITEKGKEVFIEGSTKLVIAVGASTITMTPGEININAPMVKINCPGASSSALAAGADKGSVQSGLGSEVDEIAGKSPTLQKDMEDLQKQGWKTQYGPSGGGSHANRDTQTITIDGALKNDPKQATQVLAHEVGHAKYPYKPDYSTKDAFVKGTLADEGAATMKNIQVQREIKANGGPDIGLAGNSNNHGAYNAAYDQYLKDGNAGAARDKIGSIFGNGERVSGPTNPTYNDYYGGWYDQAFPKGP